MSDSKPSILFAEDEVFIGLETKLLLEESGFSVSGPIGSVHEALEELERSDPDLGLLDVNLNGIRITPVAEAMRARAIPFALLTGYSPGYFQEPVLREAVLLRKPFNQREALVVLQRLLETNGAASRE